MDGALDASALALQDAESLEVASEGGKSLDMPMKKPAAAVKASAKKQPPKAKVPAKKPAAAKKEAATAKAKSAAVKKEIKEKTETEGKPAKEKVPTLFEKASSWKKQMDAQSEEAAEEPDSEGEQIGDLARRDLAKARKYKRMSDSQAIPEHIQECMAKAKTRADKSRLINELFEKDSKGNMIMKADKPVFTSVQKAKHTKLGQDVTIGEPYDIFLHRVFHGDESAMTRAQEKGSVMVWSQDGIQFAGHRQTTAGISKKVDDIHQVEGGKKEVSQETYGALSKAFNSMAFVFGDSEGPATGNNPSSAAASSEPAVQKELTEAQKKLVQDAKASMERLCAGAMKMMGKCSSVADKEKFKPHIISIRSWIAKDDHMLLWNEFEDGRVLSQADFKGWMTEQAEAVVSLNEECEKFKALLRTRKEL